MSEDITFRPARKADFAGIDALLARVYPRLLKADYPPSVLVLALPIIARARPELVVSGTYWVAQQGDQIIGAGGWTADAPNDGAQVNRLGHVRHVVCDDRCLRRGVARGLMARALDQARAAGVARLDCLSTRTAVPFYTALGFERGAEVEISLGPGIGFPAVQMQRSI